MKIVPMLGKIIEAKGRVVPDEYYRTGRRWRCVDDKVDCTRKPGVRQRKAALVQAVPPAARGGLRVPYGPGFCSRGPQGGGLMPVSGVVVQKQK